MSWDQLPDYARVWVYVANRPLTDADVAAANTALKAFVREWTAHRRQLAAYGDVVRGRFVRLAVDESQAGASGCSIDASVRFLQDLGRRLGVDFFERTTFFVDAGDGFAPHDREALAAAHASGQIHDTTPSLDPLVNTKGDFDRAFVKPLGESWLKRMVG